VSLFGKAFFAPTPASGSMGTDGQWKASVPPAYGMSALRKFGAAVGSAK
jgi:hypothetical protein